MEELKEIKTDVKEIRSDVSDIKVILAKNTQSLIFHIERTTLNERRIESVEKWLFRLLGAILAAIVLKSFLG